MDISKNTVYKDTSSILRRLDNTRDTPKTRAILANIRNSIEKNISNNIEALAFVFSNMPEEFVGNRKELNNYEKSVLTSIQMYALHQQSKLESVLKLDYNDGEYRENLGDALSSLRGKDSMSIDRRFNAMITSSNFKEFKIHLRHMIKLLKARSEVRVDYASLSDDIYWLLNGQKENIKIKWARSYYKFRKEENEGEN